MAGAGGDRVITALLSVPRLGARGYLAALPAVINEREIEKRFRAYQADCLRVITENTAKYAGGSYIQSKWSDLMEQKTPDTRTAKDIVEELAAKGGIRIKPAPKR